MLRFHQFLVHAITFIAILVWYTPAKLVPRDRGWFTAWKLSLHWNFWIATLRQSNIAGWKMDLLKMYFLLKMGIFQPAMLVYQRATLEPDPGNANLGPSTRCSLALGFGWWTGLVQRVAEARLSSTKLLKPWRNVGILNSGSAWRFLQILTSIWERALNWQYWGWQI